MKKQLRIITGSKIVVCKWSKENYSPPKQFKAILGRHLKRNTIYHFTGKAYIIDVKNGWYLHCYANGRKLLSVLPF